MERSLSAGDLVRLREEREVDIVTRAAPSAPVHDTTIWVVVDRRDRVLVRTYLGPGSRWYREALAQPDVLLRLGDDLLTFTAAPATDADRIEACSDGLLRKYAGDPSAEAMVADEVLDTTLELVPRWARRWGSAPPPGPIGRTPVTGRAAPAAGRGPAAPS